VKPLSEVKPSPIEMVPLNKEIPTPKDTTPPPSEVVKPSTPQNAQNDSKPLQKETKSPQKEDAILTVKMDESKPAATKSPQKKEANLMVQMDQSKPAASSTKKTTDSFFIMDQEELRTPKKNKPALSVEDSDDRFQVDMSDVKKEKSEAAAAAAAAAKAAEAEAAVAAAKAAEAAAAAAAAAKTVLQNKVETAADTTVTGGVSSNGKLDTVVEKEQVIPKEEISSSVPPSGIDSSEKSAIVGISGEEILNNNVDASIQPSIEVNNNADAKIQPRKEVDSAQGLVFGVGSLAATTFIVVNGFRSKEEDISPETGFDVPDPPKYPSNGPKKGFEVGRRDGRTTPSSVGESTFRSPVPTPTERTVLPNAGDAPFVSQPQYDDNIRNPCDTVFPSDGAGDVNEIGSIDDRLSTSSNYSIPAPTSSSVKEVMVNNRKIRISVGVESSVGVGLSEEELNARGRSVRIGTDVDLRSSSMDAASLIDESVGYDE